MEKYIGAFEFSGFLKVKASEALDPRVVASSKADLIKKSNWPSDGDTIYVYKGLIVDCGDDGVYRLLDPAKALNLDFSGWQRIDAGSIDGIFTYKGSISNYDLLPTDPKIGDVYNIESDFEIHTGSELDDNYITKRYPAGTNIAWNGENWDPLAGSIDLSNYATKTDLANTEESLTEVLTTSLVELSTGISGLLSDLDSKFSGAISSLHTTLDNKVDKIEGNSLIPQEKLLLIDTSATLIGTLITRVENNESAIESLQLANSTLLNELGGSIKTLQETVGEHTTSLNNISNSLPTILLDIEDIKKSNSTLDGNIETLLGSLSSIESNVGGLTTRLGKAEESLTTTNTNLSTLSTNLGVLSEEVKDIETTISNIKIPIVNNDKVLSLSDSGVLSTNLSLNYDISKQEIQLLGKNDSVISSFDATSFVKDGMLESASYDKETLQLTLSVSGKSDIVVDMKDTITYSAGQGLQLVGNSFSVKLDTNTNNLITASDNGLLVNSTSVVNKVTPIILGGINNTIADKVDEAIQDLDIDNRIDARINNALDWDEKE